MKIGLLGPQGQGDSRKSKKLEEVAGFCAVILRYVRQFLTDKKVLTVLECSCGKSYLGLTLGLLLRELEDKEVRLTGVDVRPDLIERCRDLSQELGLSSVRLVASRTIEFESSDIFDMVLSLHACDSATDEAIAKGIELQAYLILAVPCCQNQIRGQIKGPHPLQAMTQYGPVRYRFASMLTDVLRAQFLNSAGYHVEMAEIGSERLTPKNLCICARKAKRKSKRPRDQDYKMLRELFNVKPRIETYCPGIVSGDD